MKNKLQGFGRRMQSVCDLPCRGWWIVCITALLLTPSLRAQGRGVIEGRLANGTDRTKIAARVSLDVIGFTGGMGILKSSVTDAAGKFRIEGLPTDAPLMVQANYKSVNYHSMVRFDASGKAQVELEVFEPTDSPTGIHLDSLRMAFQLEGGRLQCLEETTFSNRTQPPVSFMNPDGNFRFSKPPGLVDPPRMNVSGPGASMPLQESPLESPDGLSYYSTFPLRPGITTFEVQQVLPYSDRTYTYRKKFYRDVDAFEIGVVPRDVAVSGVGLTKVQTDPQKNFVVYTGGPVKAGTELAWTFSGGTPVADAPMPESRGESSVKPGPTPVRRNALLLGPIILLGLMMALVYAFNRNPAGSQQGRERRTRELNERREQLLDYLAGLEHKSENKSLERREYLRQRELGMRQLRRISLLLKK
jgi:hypothetical protein